MSSMELDITSYLAQNYKDKISYEKLETALSMRSNDEPLV